MLTGKRPTDPMFTNGVNIVNFVERSLPDQIFSLVDASVLERKGDHERSSQQNSFNQDAKF
jgi:hypothetical protein